MLERVFTPDNLGYEIELPEDSATWTGEMNRILFSAFPEVSNFPVKLTLDRFEPQKLYAKGSYTVDIGGRILIIPVIVKSKKMQPLDIALVDGEWQYLTSDLISNLVNSNVSLGDPMNNKDSIDFYSQPILNDTPYYSGNRNTRVITASVISNEDKTKLAGLIATDKFYKNAAAKNASFNSVVSAVLKTPVREYKSAFVTRDSFLNSSIYITDANNKREKISTAFAEAKAFVKRHMPEQYVDFIKTGSACALANLDSDDSDSIPSIGMGGMSSILDKIFKKVSGPGMFNFLSDDASEGHTAPVMVIKIKQMRGPGSLMGLGKGGLLHDVSDSEAVPSKMPGSDIISSLTSKSPDELISGEEIMPSDNGDFLEPITVERVVELPIGKAIIGKTKASGDPFIGIILSKFNKEKSANDCSGLLPTDAKPIYLSPSTVLYKVAMYHDKSLINSKREYLNKIAKQTEPLKISFRGGNTFAIKSASENILCESNALPYYLDSFGVRHSDIIKTAEEAKSNGQAVVFIPLKKCASAVLSKSLRNKISKVNWVKTATYLDSEESVDSALSLEYLKDDTAAEFYEQIPVYKKALSSMAKLMASVRLGNDVVDEEVLSNAMEAMDALIQELTVFREGT